LTDVLLQEPDNPLRFGGGVDIQGVFCEVH
jgi:hypothetical protein